MTSSIEAAFGSGVFVAGFLLNNQLTDFSFKPTDAQGKPIANAAAACKRPRSSMSPLMVLDDAGELELAIGSPGGSRIIQYTARVVVDVLDHGLDLQQAISRPNLTWRNQHLELENDCGEPAPPAALVAGLEQRGHTLKQTSLTSGLHGVQRTADGWLGGVDPRREGEVRFVPSPATEDGLADRVSLKAVVEIDPKPGGKRFQGVWLVREGLPKLLVDYRRRSLWLAFEGKAVEVQGEPYEPEGQAIQAPHFRVHGLTLSDAEAATSWIGFGPEQELEGRFELREGEPGSKSEGVSTLVFVTSESSWEVLNPEPAMEGTASVKARSVDRSATAAHATGPALWVRSVD
jgi:hypothetical protein